MRNRGLTLIELLVAIVIITTLVAAVIPAMTPTTSERRIREAARGLNTFIATQQARALTGRRQLGIGLKKLSFDTKREADRGVCLEVYAVEQPAPFMGFDSNSAARVAISSYVDPDAPTESHVQIEMVTRGGSVQQSADLLPSGWDPDLLPAGVIRPGDVIEIAGNRYRIKLGMRNRNVVPLDNDTVIDQKTGFFRLFDAVGGRPAGFLATPLNATGQSVVPYHNGNGERLNIIHVTDLRSGRIRPQFQKPTPPHWSKPTRYKIHRQPAVTSSPPYQLPEGVAVDLQGSGAMDDAPLHLEGALRLSSESIDKFGVRNNNDMVFVMFAPDGSIGSINYNIGGTGLPGEPPKKFVSVRPTSSLSLLLGRREMIPVDTTITFTDGATSEEIEARKRQINWLNLEGAWVNVGYQTGSVITTDLANVDPVDVATKATMSNGIPDYAGDSVDALDIRREQILRSREFARESSRLGGK
jgi:prepilin-type N-terminal cleavage/methylation domain-containing protein